MASTTRKLMAVAGFVGFLGLGGALWSATTPNQEQMRRVAKEYPSTPQQLAEQRHVNEQMMAILKEAAVTNKNVASEPWPWKK